MRKTGLKLLLISLLVLILAFTFVACNKKTNEGSSTPQEPVVEPVDDTPQETVVAVLTSNGEADPYESSILSSARLVCGAKEKRIVTHTVNQNNIDDTVIALKDEGATVVISTNPALETALVEAAKLFPKMRFITLGGVKANFEKLGNYHNAYISMHEARYLNGIAAGMKLNQYITNGDIDEDSARIGFIATEQSSAQVSAYTAFYLGAKSVCPTVKMSVKFATSEQDITDSVNALATIGCKVISQYSYNDDVVTEVCNEHDEPIPNVTFMSDYSTDYPSSFLTGFTINWRPYFTYLIDTLDAGETLATDWSGTISNNSVSIYPVNNTIAPSGTAEAIETALNKIKTGALNVFDSSTFTVDKAPLTSYIPAISTTINALLPSGETSYIVESNAKTFRSYPYFGLLIDGIYYDPNVTIRHMGQFTIDESQLPPEDDTLTPAEKYFTALIAGAKSISGPQLDTQTDKVDISISGYYEYDSDIAHSIKRQYALDLVLDLPSMNNETTPTFGDSALRLKITNSTDANLFTIWYFTKDTSDTIFIQYKNEYFKVGLGADFDINSVLEYLNTLAEDDDANSSADDENIDFDFSAIIKTIGTFINNIRYSDFSLDTVTVKSIFKLFDINVDEFLTSPTALALLGTLGLTVEDVQNMTVEDLLINFSSFIIDEDQVTIKENLDGSTTYVSKDLSKRLKTLVNSFANNLLAYISFGLSFTVPKDETAFSELTFDFYSSYTNYQHFDVRVHVEDFKIDTITEESTTLLEKASTYKDYLEFELKASIDLKNKISVNIKDEIVPLGKFDLDAYLALDFKGEGSENKTSMKVVLKSDNVQVLKIVLLNGTIGIDVNLNNVQMQAITNVFLKDICKLIKDYTVGEQANVAFTFIGEVIDELLSKVFDTNGDINTGFVNITITNIDVPVLSRGILNSIVNVVLIGTNNELPIEERVEPTPEVSLSIFSDEDKSSLFSYDIQMSTNSLLKVITNAIKYDANTSKISIELSDIKNTLKTLYSGGKDSISSTNDLMAYFVGTDDSIILSLTEHGLLPLYKENTLGTKYITADYTIEQAIADGYTSMQGAMILKANATNIWKYVSKSASDLPYTKILTYRGAYVPKNGDYATEEEYLDSFIFNRYYNMFKNSTILAGKNNINEVLTAILDGTNSINFVYYEAEDKADLTIVMLGETFTAGIDFDLHGVDADDIQVAELTDTSAVADGNKLLIDLDTDFYDLFKAVTGTGYGSSLTDFGTNNSLYYIASNAVYDAEEEKYTSIELSGSAIVLMSDTEFKYVSAAETKNGTYTIGDETGVFTFVTLNDIADGTQFDILGSKFKVLVQKA